MNLTKYGSKLNHVAYHTYVKLFIFSRAHQLSGFNI